MSTLSTLASKISSSSVNIKNFAVEAAAEVDDLRARVAKLEAPAPTPVPTPGPLPAPAPSSSWPPPGAYVASDWSKGIVSPWQIAGNASDVAIVDCPWRPGEKAVAITAGAGAAPPGGDPTTGGLLSTLTAVYCPQASGVSHAMAGAETWEREEIYLPPGTLLGSGDWQDFDEHHPTFTGAYGNVLRFVTDAQPGENAATSLLPGMNPRIGAAVRGGVKGGPLNQPGGEWRQYFEMPKGSLRFGRPIDVLKHWKWNDKETDPLFELYLDGARVWTCTHPDLYTVDARENWGLYVYVRNVPWRTTVIYGRVANGPTLPSVGGLALAA